MPDEIPPLGKFVISSFEANDLGYPVVVVGRDPKIPGYTLPALGAAPSDPRYAATHIFTGVQLSQLDARAVWKYEKLPGPAVSTTRIDADGMAVTVTRQRMKVADIVTSEAVSTGIWTCNYKSDGDSYVADQVSESRAVPGNAQTSVKFDEDSETFVTVTRTLKAVSAITPATTYSANTSATKTEREDINGSELVAYEVTTVFLDSAHNDLASAKVEYNSHPYTMPARVDVTTFLESAGVPVGLYRPTPKETPFTVKTFWVIASSEPTLSLDTIDYGGANILLPDGFNLGECIHDSATVNYPTLGNVTYAATTPSYTTFIGSWVGTAKAIRGSVENAKHPHRWKVTYEYATIK